MRNEPSSFRDPLSSLYWKDSRLYRKLSGASYRDYKLLMSSGLYAHLTKRGMLVRHSQIADSGDEVTIEPELIPVVSYPYEWSFAQLRAAALLTLQIQEMALAHEMSLKDASAYNVQFVGSVPVLIDTGSFEAYVEGEPWVAYRQFCQHFLAPLALMRYTRLDLGALLRLFIDGVPLDLATTLLPLRARLRPSMALHIVAHGVSQKRHADNHERVVARRIPKYNVLAILSNLGHTIEGLQLKRLATEWGAYYTFTNYNDNAFRAKSDIIRQWCDRIAPKRVLDLGSNNGQFSRVVLEAAAVEYAISADIDPVAVNANYVKAAAEHDTRILPLRIDLTNPSPALGWNNTERSSFRDRAQSDLVLALALVHHLAISNNVPLRQIAAYFRELAPALIVEFVPKSDSQTQKLLANRKDVFPDYTEAGFGQAFGEYFTLEKKSMVRDSQRTMYLYRAHAKTT